MLKELLKFDKIGSKDEISVLLFQFLSPFEYKRIKDIRKLCIHHSYSFGSSFNGVIYFLQLLGLIQNQNNTLKTNSKIHEYSQDSFFENSFIFEKLFTILKEENELNSIFNYQNTKIDCETLMYYVKESKIPTFWAPVKKFLISTNFFFKKENVPNIYYINPLFNNLFSIYVISNLKRSQSKKKISLAELKAIQLTQEKYGDIAEEFVLKFERKRLAKHPFKLNIRRISTEFVNAGYDLESYNSEDSIVNDRYIEVKSHHDKVSFYWTRNEYEVANELGDCYYIYLVDSNRIEIKDYAPVIIQNPFNKLFDKGEWISEIEKYRFDLK